MLLRRLLTWSVLAALSAAALSASVPPTAIPTLTVAGKVVPARGVTTVADALQRAQVVVPSGRVLTAVSHRPLSSDHRPGEVRLDGVAVAPEAVVRPGAVLTVVPGQDVVEPLRLVWRRVVSGEDVASLYVGGRPGSRRVLQGVLSGETVSRQALVPPRRGRLVSAGAIALTFDDGPDPAWTPRILRALHDAHLRATFCLIGREVVKHPALVRAIVKGGHQLCNHTWAHDEQLRTRRPDVARADLMRTQAAIVAACGVAPRLFRAPGGNWSPGLERLVRSVGLTPLKWNVDPRDWTRPGTRRVVGATLRQMRPGSIVLLHDGGGDRSQTVAAMRWLLPRLARWHYVARLPQPAF